MIVHRMAQGSPEWRAIRAGVATASCFDKIMTPKKLEPSSQAATYMHTLVAEALLGVPIEDTPSPYMQRGTDLEAEAVGWYEFTRNDGRETERVGFITTDDGRIGCSPDRLVGDRGGLEVKVPLVHTHVGYLLNPQTLVEEYRQQVQGGLWIAEREWWDLLSYSPVLPPLVMRVTPDLVWRRAADQHIRDFVVRVDAARARIAPLIAAAEAPAA